MKVGFAHVALGVANALGERVHRHLRLGHRDARREPPDSLDKAHSTGKESLVPGRQIPELDRT